jgi:hypothetical protein
LKYSLIEILLAWKHKRTPELPAAQYLPVFVDPADAFLHILSDLLSCHYGRLNIYFKLWLGHNFLLIIDFSEVSWFVNMI